MLPFPDSFKKYAKVIVAIGGFLVILANAITGTVDANGLFEAGVALLTALGVYTVSNNEPA